MLSVRSPGQAITRLIQLTAVRTVGKVFHCDFLGFPSFSYTFLRV